MSTADEYHPRFPMLSVGGDALTLLVPPILSGLKPNLFNKLASIVQTFFSSSP